MHACAKPAKSLSTLCLITLPLWAPPCLHASYQGHKQGQGVGCTTLHPSSQRKQAAERDGDRMHARRDLLSYVPPAAASPSWPTPGAGPAAPSWPPSAPSDSPWKYATKKAWLRGAGPPWCAAGLLSSLLPAAPPAGARSLSSAVVSGGAPAAWIPSRGIGIEGGGDAGSTSRS
jgi:hypothetical protein